MHAYSGGGSNRSCQRGNVRDTPARLAAQILLPRLGQAIVVESRPRAGGAIGTKAVSKAANVKLN
jgi:tripartite-type tricarboxylate transporter receptor subunit TctC